MSEFGSVGTEYLYSYTQAVASSDAELLSLTAKVAGVDLLEEVVLSNLMIININRTNIGKSISILGIADKKWNSCFWKWNKSTQAGLNTFDIVVKSEDGLSTTTYIKNICIK